MRAVLPIGVLPRLAVVAMALCAIAALLSPVLADSHMGVPQLTLRLQPPFWLGGKGHFLLGSDQLGRGVASRVLLGLRVSLLIALVAATAAALLGLVVGLVAGYARGVSDAALMRLVDIQLSFPFLVLAIAVVAVLGHSIPNLLVVLILWGWASFARIARGEILALREREFVHACYALGARPIRVMSRHLLPNVLPKLLVIWTYMLAQMAVAEGGLSFLGLGVEEPFASLATLINDGRVHLSTAWWVATFPGLLLMIFILGVNFLGDGLADVLSPRTRGLRVRVL